MGGEGFDRLGQLEGFIGADGVAALPRPDAKRAMATSKLPGSGDAIAVSRAGVGDVMGAYVGLGPAACPGYRIVAAVYNKAANIVHSVACKDPA